MKWIKASERLPVLQKQTVLRHTESGKMYLGNADRNDEGVWLFIQSSDAYRAWTVDDWMDNLDKWEWLDESESDNILLEALEKIADKFEHLDYGNKSENCPVCIATEAINKHKQLKP